MSTTQYEIASERTLATMTRPRENSKFEMHLAAKQPNASQISPFSPVQVIKKGSIIGG
jgi:hypothetical protein